jgi:hypothetical protein
VAISMTVHPTLHISAELRERNSKGGCAKLDQKKRQHDSEVVFYFRSQYITFFLGKGYIHMCVCVCV